TRAISRLRALGQGVKVFCLDQDKLYCVPSASGDGSAYQVQVSGETMLCSCPAGIHDKCCKHVGAVEMFREAQEQLAQATSRAVDVRMRDQLERSLEDKLADLY
ncbi:MAG: SWIM zinc finger family protein, partial [Chloroflexi bacterium]|nr:SWIM zinc finger family protein [Chloroflexota bacterium]